MLIAPEDLARPACVGTEAGDGARELRREVRARLGVERVVLASAGEVDVRADEEVGVWHQGAASLQKSECDEHEYTGQSTATYLERGTGHSCGGGGEETGEGNDELHSAEC